MVDLDAVGEVGGELVFEVALAVLAELGGAGVVHG